MNRLLHANTTHAILGLAVALSPFGTPVSVSVAQDRDVRFTLLTIDANPPNSPWYKMVGDVTGDGMPDIVVGGRNGPLLAYVAPDWKKAQIGNGGWGGVRGQIADLDGDGDADIVMGGVVWFENPGTLDKLWENHRIDDRRMHDIEVADLDGDRRLDVVARDQSAFGRSGNKIHAYYLQDKGGWSRQVIDCPHGEGLKLADIDGDADADIVIGGLWYENPGDTKSRWGQHQYTSEWTEPDAKVELADFNGDGRADVVLTPAELKDETYRVCWYEAPVDRLSKNWIEHVVVESIECVVHALGVGDFDGDQDVDIVLAEMHQGKDPDEVCVLFNGNNGTSWRKQVLSRRGSHDIVVVDIDNDGDLDIIGANHGGVHPLEMWKNASRKVPMGVQQ